MKSLNYSGSKSQKKSGVLQNGKEECTENPRMETTCWTEAFTLHNHDCGHLYQTKI